MQQQKRQSSPSPVYKHHPHLTVASSEGCRNGGKTGEIPSSAPFVGGRLASANGTPQYGYMRTTNLAGGSVAVGGVGTGNSNNIPCAGSLEGVRCSRNCDYIKSSSSAQQRNPPQQQARSRTPGCTSRGVVIPQLLIYPHREGWSPPHSPYPLLWNQQMQGPGGAYQPRGTNDSATNLTQKYHQQHNDHSRYAMAATRISGAHQSPTPHGRTHQQLINNSKNQIVGCPQFVDPNRCFLQISCTPDGMYTNPSGRVAPPSSFSSPITKGIPSPSVEAPRLAGSGPSNPNNGGLYSSPQSSPKQASGRVEGKLIATDHLEAQVRRVNASNLEISSHSNKSESQLPGLGLAEAPKPDLRKDKLASKQYEQQDDYRLAALPILSQNAATIPDPDRSLDTKTPVNVVPSQKQRQCVVLHQDHAAESHPSTLNPPSGPLKEISTRPPNTNNNVAQQLIFTSPMQAPKFDLPSTEAAPERKAFGNKEAEMKYQHRRSVSTPPAVMSCKPSGKGSHVISTGTGDSTSHFPPVNIALRFLSLFKSGTGSDSIDGQTTKVNQNMLGDHYSEEHTNPRILRGQEVCRATSWDTIKGPTDGSLLLTSGHEGQQTKEEPAVVGRKPPTAVYQTDGTPDFTSRTLHTAQTRGLGANVALALCPTDDAKLSSISAASTIKTIFPDSDLNSCAEDHAANMWTRNEGAKPTVSCESTDSLVTSTTGKSFPGVFALDVLESKRGTERQVSRIPSLKSAMSSDEGGLQKSSVSVVRDVYDVSAVRASPDMLKQTKGAGNTLGSIDTFGGGDKRKIKVNNSQMINIGEASDVDPPSSLQHEDVFHYGGRRGTKMVKKWEARDEFGIENINLGMFELVEGAVSYITMFSVVGIYLRLKNLPLLAFPAGI